METFADVCVSESVCAGTQDRESAAVHPYAQLHWPFSDSE